MSDVNEDSEDVSIDAQPRSAPSGWLVFYSLVFLCGGVYLFYSAFAKEYLFRPATFVAAVYSAIVGVMLWFRTRFALQAYLLMGVGVLCWTAYSCWSAGYTTSILGLIIGGVMILLGG